MLKVELLFHVCFHYFMFTKFLNKKIRKFLLKFSINFICLTMIIQMLSQCFQTILNLVLFFNKHPNKISIKCYNPNMMENKCFSKSIICKSFLQKSVSVFGSNSWLGKVPVFYMRPDLYSRTIESHHFINVNLQYVVLNYIAICRVSSRKDFYVIKYQLGFQWFLKILFMVNIFCGKQWRKKLKDIWSLEAAICYVKKNVDDYEWLNRSDWRPNNSSRRTIGSSNQLQHNWVPEKEKFKADSLSGGLRTSPRGFKWPQ